jgi:hypothetical protein
MWGDSSLSTKIAKKLHFFLANNFLVAEFPRPTLHTSNTVDKLNKPMLSGLVIVFMLVLLLVCWWWWCCSLLGQWTTVSLATVVAEVAAVAVAAVVDNSSSVKWCWWGGGVFDGSGSIGGDVQWG